MVPLLPTAALPLPQRLNDAAADARRQQLHADMPKKGKNSAKKGKAEACEPETELQAEQQPEQGSTERASSMEPELTVEAEPEHQAVCPICEQVIVDPSGYTGVVHVSLRPRLRSSTSKSLSTARGAAPDDPNKGSGNWATVVRRGQRGWQRGHSSGSGNGNGGRKGERAPNPSSSSHNAKGTMSNVNGPNRAFPHAHTNYKCGRKKWSREREEYGGP